MKKKTILIRIAVAAMLALVVMLSAGCNITVMDPDATQAPSAAPVQSLPENQAATQPPATEKPQPATQPPTEPATQPPTEPPTEAPTESPTEAPTEAPTQPQINAPQEMVTMLANSGLTVADLELRECTQLITVASSGNTCRLNYYTYENTRWIRNDALSCSGYVGRNGVSADKYEGDGRTPAGLFGVGEAFYIYSAPQTGLDMFEITPYTYWVDDPDSVYYNQRVEGTENKDWDSAEHMITYNPAYIYGFVINYNMDQVYNKGSAIFFHISTGGGTSGCVSTAESYVLQYLALLDKDCNPHILIQ